MLTPTFYSSHIQPFVDYFLGVTVNESEVLRLAKLAGKDDDIRLFKKTKLDMPDLHAGTPEFIYGKTFSRGSEAVVKVYGIRRKEDGNPYTDDSRDFNVRRCNISYYNNDPFALMEFKSALKRKGYATGWTGWKQFEVAKDGKPLDVCVLRNPNDNTIMVIYESPVLNPDIEGVLKMARERSFFLSTGPEKIAEEATQVS